MVSDNHRKIEFGTIAGCVALVFAGFWIFWPALRGTWLWDDGLYIVDNPYVHEPDGYWKALIDLNPMGNRYPGNYNPLTTLAEWIEWHLWGKETLGYHLVNVSLHISSALILWRLFVRLGFAFAWLGAMIFLVHPIMVESVAWISELKNTLAMPPLLLAMLAWLDYEEKGDGESYRASVLWFALSLGAKSSGLVLPVILIVRVMMKKGALARSDFKALLPFLVLSAIVALIMLAPAHLAGAHLLAQASWNLTSALASVGWSAVFLFAKCFWPVQLLPEYPGFSITSPTAWDFVPWILLLVGITLAVLGWRRSKWVPPAALGIGFFLINLVPALILIAQTYSMTAWTMDHLVYLPIIGLIGWSMVWLEYLHQRLSSFAKNVERAVIAAVLLVFCVGSHSYARVFSDHHLFWTYTVEKGPPNWQPHDNLGKLYGREGRTDEAIHQFQEAVNLNPDAEPAHYDLGLALYQQGKKDEGREQFLEAVRVNPHETRALLALAGLMQESGNIPEAEKYIAEAKERAPDASTPVAALAALRLQTGRTKEGLDLYEEAVRMAPDIFELRYNYGAMLLQSGDFSRAVEQLRVAVELNEEFAPARDNLGSALAQMGRLNEAIEQFKAALTIDPSYVTARNNLGLAYAQTGNLSAAIEQFRQALVTEPNNGTARDSLEKLLKYQAAHP